MFDNYSSEEVIRAMDRLVADVKSKCPVERHAVSIHAAREALTGCGSAWQEVERSLRMRAISTEACPETEE